MKRALVLLLILLLSGAPVSDAAPKKITVKPLQLLTTVGTPDEVSGVVVSGKNLIVYGTQDQKAYARGLDATGKELWKLPLELVLPSIATTATVDSVGDIWIAGATPSAVEPASPTPTATPLNPDNAVTPPATFIADLQTLKIWKVSAVGEMLFASTLATGNVIFPTAIAIDKVGVTIVGLVASETINAGFIINTDLDGVFSKLLQIGATATTVDAVVRHSDGSFTVAGSSAETIAAKKVVGVNDGILIKVSNTLKITAVVRSSIAKGSRIWNSASNSLLLGGEVVAAGKSESAVTKFSTSFVPKWSYRFAATGPAMTLGATQLFFISTASVPQLVWYPKKPMPLLITFDPKGIITAADSGPVGQIEVLGAVLSKEFGVLLITSSPESVSIFTRNPR